MSVNCIKQTHKSLYFDYGLLLQISQNIGLFDAINTFIFAQFNNPILFLPSCFVSFFKPLILVLKI